MIAKSIDENSVALIPEESDDLFTLRRIIKKGDRLTGDTTRAIKQEKEFSRPDRGETAAGRRRALSRIAGASLDCCR